MRSPLLAYFATAILTLALFYHLYGLAGRSLRQPVVPPIGDYGSVALMAKTAMQTGWCSINPHLGAPYQFECYDFPTPEGLNFAFFGLFGLFSDDVVLAVNLHYLLGYLLVALTALYTFRRLSFATLPAISASILFAFLPYHFMRSEYHLALSSYFLLPLLVLILVWIYVGEPLFERRKEKTGRIRLTAKGWTTVVVCILTGSSSIYYSAFGAMFLLLTGLLAASRTRRWKALLPPAFAAVLICATVIFNLAPNLFFVWANGVNPAVAHRPAGDAEIYGLKITNLLLPSPHHRLATAAQITNRYLTGVPPAGERSESLGVIIGAGFVILMAVAVFATGLRETPGFLVFFSRLNLAAVLVATVGGFGSLFNFLFFPQIRAYSRLSVYIAFFSLAALLFILHSLELRFCSTPGHALMLNAAAAVILLAGWWDLTIDLHRSFPPFLAAYQSDRDFVRHVEASVPQGSMIYQMPYLSFPEHGPLKQMTDYDPARGYIYSKHLCWSYGAMTGRPADEWQRKEAALTPEELAPSLKAAGFCGIWIDRFGYDDRAASISGRLSALIGVAPAQSGDQRFLFFPLSGCTRQGQADTQAQVSFTGCYGIEDDNRTTWRWCGPKAEIRIFNPNQAPQNVALRMTLVTGYPQFSNFRLTGDLGSWDVRGNTNGTIVNPNLNLSPGWHSIRIDSDAPRINAPNDSRTMHFQIANFQLSAR